MNFTQLLLFVAAVAPAVPLMFVARDRAWGLRRKWHRPLIIGAVIWLVALVILGVWLEVTL